jgi:mRNA interferase RelE/StbE
MSKLSYHISLPKPVQKQLDRFSQKQRQRIIRQLHLLAENPRPDGVKKLKGYENTYRLRVGDYRIIYKIQDSDKLIIILSCIHRKDAY